MLTTTHYIQQEHKMKTTRYRFETAVQAVTEGTKDWLRDEFKAILESDKDFTRKADYIGFSIASIDAKVASIDEEIKELQQLKRDLKDAKALATTVGAKVFADYGIDKLEGAGLSSITVAPAKHKVLQKIEILDEDELIKAGYSMVVVDEDAVLEAHKYKHRRELIRDYYSITDIDASLPAKLKINKRRGASNHIDWCNQEEEVS